MIGVAPAFGVSDFIASFNQTLDYTYPAVVIQGELSNLRISKNAWVYFDLKDDFSTLKFFGSVRCLPGPLEDGMMLEVEGKPYLHQQYGFSVQASSVEPIGSGSINKAYEMLLKKFEAQGLFDEARKRSLPYPPTKIGLITSRESAAYGDFVKISKKRWPGLEIVLFDVQVQGKDAPAQIVDAVIDANQNHPDVEVLVVIRGGGSKDDLSAFDVESVAATLATSRVPTLVAIGHERDVSISELVADVRASTPSNAAEILVPDILEEQLVLQQAAQYLDRSLSHYLSDIKMVIEAYKTNADRALRQRHDTLVHEVEYMAQLVKSYDPRLPLGRGYGLVRELNGNIIRSVRSVRVSDDITIELQDGSITSSVKHISESR